VTKFKDLPVEEKEIVDYYQMRWAHMIYFSGFIGMGLWMLIDPRKPQHQYIEKVTVSLFKDLWGIPFGIILLMIGLLGLGYLVMGMLRVMNYTWYRLKTGYYLFYQRKRISGLGSISNNNGSMLVFYPEKDIVLEFKGYLKSEYHKYRKASVTTAFNNDDIYWSADKDGYCIIYKGKSLNNTTSEWRGDDLIIKSNEKFLTIPIKNYRNLKDGTIRTASLA
jgi:hypothetical protein